MSVKFVFEELDETTRNYLTAVRDAEGEGAPGMFATTNTVFPGCSCLAGIVLIPLTLLVTLTDGLHIIYDDPIKIAFLQTAGLLVGGWFLFAFFRTRKTKGDAKTAGCWVYMDPINLYVAYREQVTVTRVDDVIEANYTHNYNNGKYQNSIVRIVLDGKRTTSFTLNQELRAEQFVVFVNYLAWAQGPDGKEAAKLPTASLGAVARYVARHDVEPKNADGTIDMNLVDLNIDEVPEEPTREGRATPSFMPYIVMLVAAAVIFPVMAFIVNPPIRDDALYSAVIRRPEPRFLRAYLIDPRNTLHRKEVLAALSAQYQAVVLFVDRNGEQPELRAGMVKILMLLREEADQPVVSVRVTEKAPPNLSNEQSAKSRVKKLREGFVGGDGFTGLNRDGVLDVFAEVSPPIRPPEGVVFTTPPPPIGHQLIAFVEPPENAQHAHFEIIYEFNPTDQPDYYLLTVTVEIRETIDGQPVATFTTDLPAPYKGDETSLNKAIDDLRARLVKWMVGKKPNSPE